VDLADLRFQVRQRAGRGDSMVLKKQRCAIELD
jgi:hypothetical protein